MTSRRSVWSMTRPGATRASVPGAANAGAFAKGGGLSSRCNRMIGDGGRRVVGDHQMRMRHATGNDRVGTDGREHDAAVAPRGYRLRRL
jgi:hypothetical protein